MIKTVGIVGYGHFGAFVHQLGQRFFPDRQFRVYSRRTEPDDDVFFDLKTTAQSDVVILCGSISEYEAQLQSVLKHARPDTILVDVATVKKHTSELCKTYCAGRPFLSTHPMFGPESYQKQNGNVTGFRIVVTDSTLESDQYQQVKNVFATLGFLIIEMSADEHDERLAETLFLTHYVGQSILQAGFTRTDIDTVSFQFLMDAVESVKDDAQLFADVYHYNPYCEAVAKRFHRAQDAIYKGLNT